VDSVDSVDAKKKELRGGRGRVRKGERERGGGPRVRDSCSWKGALLRENGRR